MEKLSTILSIVKQRATNMLNQKSNNKADISKTQTLPLINKDLPHKLNINHGIVLKSNEQQNLSNAKTPTSAENGICSVQIQIENMPKLVLYKLPSRLSNAKDPLDQPSESPVFVMEQIVDRDLHTSLTTMWEQLKAHYKFTARHTQTIFLKQLKATKWRKGSDLIIDSQISVGKSMIGNQNENNQLQQNTVKVKCALDIVETFHLIYVAPPMGNTKLHKQLNVRHLDQEPIFTFNKCFILMDLFIALCFLLQWPAYFWLDSALLVWQDNKPPKEIEITGILLFVGILFCPMTFFTFFGINCLFVNKLFTACPKQAVCIEILK